MPHLGRNIFSLGLARVVSGLVIFVVYIKLVNYLGPDDFGRFSLVLAYFTIFSLLVDLGVSRYVIKKISEDRTQAGVYLGNFFAAQVIISLIFFAAFVLMPKFLHYEPAVARAMMLAGLGLFVLSLSNPLAALVQAWQRITIVALVTFLHTLLNAAWLLLAVLTRQNFVTIFWVYILLGIFDFAVYWLATRKLRDFKLEWHTRLISKMVLYGLPFALISGFEMLISKLDVVIQKQFLSFTQVGYYSTAYRLIDALTFIPAVVAIALFPYFAGSARLDTAAVRDSINRFNRYMMVAAVPLGVGGALLGRNIILTLFHAPYAGSVLPFQILIWSSALTFIYAVPNIMVIVKQTRKSLGILIGGVIFNGVTNLIFIPRYGIVASAWLTVITYLLVGVAYIWSARRLAEFRFWRYGLWPAAAAAVMGSVVWQLRTLNVLAAIAIASVVYFAVLAAAGALNRDDWQFAKSMLNRAP